MAYCCFIIYTATIAKVLIACQLLNKVNDIYVGMYYGLDTTKMSYLISEMIVYAKSFVNQRQVPIKE